MHHYKWLLSIDQAFCLIYTCIADCDLSLSFNLRISGCKLNDNNYLSFIVLFKTNFYRCISISVIFKLVPTRVCYRWCGLHILPSLTPFPGCLRLGLSWFNWWVSFAPEFQCCYFCESSCLFYPSFNFDFYVSKIMHL